MYNLICAYKELGEKDYFTYSFNSDAARFQFIRLNGHKLAYIKLYETENTLERVA